LEEMSREESDHKEWCKKTKNNMRMSFRCFT
jgi:hypothetical protein